MNRAEDGSYTSTSHYYYNMDVPAYYMCGKDLKTRTTGVTNACPKSLRSSLEADGYVDYFVHFYKVYEFFIFKWYFDDMLRKIF